MSELLLLLLVEWQGYRTGHIYRDALTRQWYGRIGIEVDIAVKKPSLSNDTGYVLSLSVCQFVFYVHHVILNVYN